MSTALFGLWRRWLLILTLGAAAAGAVAAYSFTAAKHYEATATLVVSPVAVSDATFLGIDVLRESQRRAAAETAAALIRSPEVAETARVRLGLRRTASGLLDDVSTDVVGASDAVTVTATDTSPARAAQIANAFVDAFVSSRTAAFQSEVVSAVARLQRRLVAMAPNERVGPAGAQLQRRLADTRALIGMRDPTVSAGSEAVQPSSASWPKPVRWTIYAALAGLGAGLLVALALGLPAMLRRREPLLAARGDVEPSERLVGRLERRLSDRLDAVVAEQKRLAAREAGLEVREREIAGKLDELGAAASQPAPPPAEPAPAPAEAEPALVEPAPVVDTSALEEIERREQMLAKRLDAVAQRERELARRGAALSQAESQLTGKESAAERRDEELAERARTLDAREEELRAAESKVSAERAASAEREAELAERASRLAVQPPEPPAAPPAAPPARPSQPPPAAAQAPAWPLTDAQPVARGRGGWLLEELERLVERESASQPERIDEWRSYLFYLRNYTDSAGRVPAQFDWLIEDTFGDLLARR